MAKVITLEEFEACIQRLEGSKMSEDEYIKEVIMRSETNCAPINIEDKAE